MKFVAGTIFIFLFIHSSAQSSFIIQGTVSDSSGKSITDGLVSLFTQKDSVAVEHVLVENGRFGFQPVQRGGYFIRISSYGYRDYIRTLTMNGNEVLKVTLIRNSLALGEIQVTGYRQAFSYKNGNIKATIENTVLSTIPDAIEVLAKLPTVQVSADREAVSIIGKGTPVIYLENQRITLNELNALSVNDIKTIEIINNPSSKYDAEGRAVILVTRRTNAKDGIRVDANETASKKRYFENRAGVNMSFRRQKTEWKGNLQYNHINRFEGIHGVLNEDRLNYTSGFGGTSVGPRRQLLYGLGMYRQLNATDYFSMNMSGRLQDEHAEVNTSSFSEQPGSETHALNNNNTVNRRPYVNTNVNYLKKFKPGNSQLFVGGQYAWYNTNVSNMILQQDSGNQEQPREKRQQYFAINVGTLRLDYEKNFANNIRWESGGVWNVSQSNTNFDVFYFPDKTFSHTLYDYRENNRSIYTQASGNYKQLTYTAGIRAESSVLKGGYPDSSNLLLDRKFVYPFPKISLSFEMDSNQTLSLNYARSINRPNYASANQVSIYITPFLERTNNINISPSIFNEITLNYQYKTYAFKLNMFQITNSASYIIEYDDQLNKYRMINRNIADYKGVNLSVSVPVNYKIFSSTNEIIASLNRASDARANTSKVSPFYYVYSFNQLKLPRNYTFMLTGWFTTDQFEGIFETNGKFAIDIALSKVFFKRLTCSVNAFDIFRSLNNIESFSINNIYMSTNYIENVKEFSIALKYSFGNMKDTRFKNKEVNENGARLN